MIRPGLKWEDIVGERQTDTIRQSADRGSLDETKTASSKARLPLHPALGDLLLAWKMTCEAEWIFASPATKSLMRHSALLSTFHVYGKALSPEKREANRKLVEMLLPQATA